MNPQLKRGTLELCVLALLSDRDCYGYELVNAISESIHITEGTIYPLMKRLKDEGCITSYLVESSEGPSRKYYSLTDTGRKKLSVHCRSARTLARWMCYDGPPNHGGYTYSGLFRHRRQTVPGSFGKEVPGIPTDW